ncbi:hypothetical protein IIA79_00130 [bacterium]|nr:hypothetical protein [bacterium]
MAQEPEVTYGLLAAVPIKTHKHYDHPDEYEPAYPNLMVKELLMAIAVIIVLHVASIIFNAPLEEIANPDFTPSPAKAPWYFLGLQELLHYAPPLIAGVIVPGLIVGSLMVLPFFTGRWVMMPLVSMVAAVIAPLLDNIPFRSGGLMSITVYLLLMLLAYLWLRRRPQLDQRPELVARLRNMLFFAFVICFSTVTAIGTFFRGPEWRWVWPWAGGS